MRFTLAIISGLLCVAALCLWYDSYRYAGYFDFNDANQSTIGHAEGQAFICLERSGPSTVGRFVGYEHIRMPIAGWRNLNKGHRYDWSGFLGFSGEWHRSEKYVCVPYWFIALAFAIYPGVYLRRWWGRNDSDEVTDVE